MTTDTIAGAPAQPTSSSKATIFLSDLRTCAALAREYDWARLQALFASHGFPPIAALAAAARNALQSMPAFSIGPSQIIELAWGPDRESVAELLAVFGILA